MQILELHLKNFGKFTDRHIYFTEHMQVIHGENEYGKSTIYAFIKAMLFGMERGRGRAAAKDAFSRYEPWENPNYYAGAMRFCCGGRTFYLERTFDRYAKKASLVCEDDGEELSVEAGDLEMLLGGITASSFENTAAIGQLTAKPDQGLAAELKNYAANYYETGSGDVNLQGALDWLKDKKRRTEQAQKEHREDCQKKVEKLRIQKRYVEMDEEHLQEKLTETKEELKSAKQKAERVKKAQDAKFETVARQQEERKERGGFRRICLVIGCIVTLFGVGGLIVSWFMESFGLEMIWGVVLILIGMGVATAGLWRKTDLRSVQEESDTKEVSEPVAFRELHWEIARLQEEGKEKSLLKRNLQEQIEEVEEDEETDRKLQEKIQMLDLAGKKLREAAEEMVHRSGERMNREASEILRSITNGRYHHLLIDEHLDMAVLSEGRRIPVERLSRGTMEQIYFSLRMGALNLLYEEEVPVILDDAFVYYDEKRLKSVLKWLSEQPRQVIMFSCQTREKQLVDSLERWKDEAL